MMMFLRDNLRESNEGVSVRHKETSDYAAAAPPTGRQIAIHGAAVLMLRDGEDAAQGWEGGV